LPPEIATEIPVRTADLHYDLPGELIAAEPPPERDGGRLLVQDRATGALTHRSILDLPALLAPGALLVVNDTRVIPARLIGHKPSGGRAEVFLLRPLDSDARRWRALGRASKPIRPGTTVAIADGFDARIDARSDGGALEVTLLAEDPWASIERHGQVPLPPYIARAPRPEDRARYQTVFAARPGAVAAPTAGLHLSDALLAALAARGVERAAVTLHVGAGTFAPVTVDDLDVHPMHSETYAIPDDTAAAVLRARREGRPVVAVGTTVVRTLETWGAAPGTPLRGETALLIQPGYAFRVVDQLLTNFHLPRSTLLALVMAFAGVEPVRRAYTAAVAERYRFFSYGDAMLLR
jgi:S-adenosylmethionine:tRNA ribosyltransferase-isomerase